MTDKLTIYNGALLFIGEGKLASIASPATEEKQRLLDSVWDRGGINDCLSDGQWNFAMRAAKLDYETSIEPSFGPSRAFEKPSDLVRLCGFCYDAYFSSPIDNFSEEAGYWYADVDELYIKYVSNDSSWGSDYSLWTSRFTRYVEAYFGTRIAPALVKDINVRALLTKEMKNLLSLAQSQDAMSGPSQALPMGSWRASRYGSGRGDRGRYGSGRGDRGSTTSLIG